MTKFAPYGGDWRPWQTVPHADAQRVIRDSMAKAVNDNATPVTRADIEAAVAGDFAALMQSKPGLEWLQ